MTTSDYKKMFVQLNVKPAIKAKYIKHNAPNDRKFGKSTKKCKRCGRMGAHLGQYDLNLCRQCFREIASEIGFKKYR